MRVLSDDRVEIETRNGTKQVVRADSLTMVKRPNGTAPTKDKRAVLAEDNRRTKDPERGDGTEAPDRGNAGDLDPEEHTAASLSPEVLQYMSDSELSALLNDGFAGDYDRDTVEAIAAEADRRDADADTPAAFATAFEAAKDDAEKVAAASQAWPAAWLEWARGVENYKGVSQTFEIQNAYEEYIEYRMLAAEAATNGIFFKAPYDKQPPFNPNRFFTGSLNRDAERNKYISRELAEWFSVNGHTLSFADFKRQYLGGAHQERSGWRSEFG